MTPPFTKEQEDALAAYCRAAKAWQDDGSPALSSTPSRAAMTTAYRNAASAAGGWFITLEECAAFASLLLDRIATAEAEAAILANALNKQRGYQEDGLPLATLDDDEWRASAKHKSLILGRMMPEAKP